MVEETEPDWALLYLPTLDYAAQREGPESAAHGTALEEFRAQLERLADFAQRRNAAFTVAGDYAIHAVDAPPAFPNAVLRAQGFFNVRPVAGRAYPDFYTSRAFAMCDHEIAHVYVRDPADVPAVSAALEATGAYESCTPRTDQDWAHPSAGELLLVAKKGSWCAYPWWTDRREAPDWATHVDIHNKPGYDPCELFFGGFFPPRTCQDPARVKGTHGRACETAWASTASVSLVGLSWWLIDPHLEGADEYPGGVVLRDNAGTVLRVSLGPDDEDCRPYYVASREDWVVKALVAAEDRRFFEHSGVNLPSVVRAAFQNVTSLRRVSGASTITMQATRLIHPHPRTLAWKYVEAFRAMQTERAHDKLWIISQYLNRAPFGSNLVGVEAAAQGWFGKRAKDLGIGEAALLAGMVQCPTRFRPDRHLDRALARRAYVLGRMRALGVITPEQYEGAAASVPEIRRAPRPFAEPFFCDWAAARVARAGIVGGDFATTLDADVQARATTLVNRAAANGYSAAAVVMRVDTAAVLALACSGDYFSPKAGQVNTALSPRPAGSTLKPFLTAAAMDCGFVTPEERLADVPKAYHGYTPANFSATHRGSVKLADALVLSLNLPFVQLLQRLGVPRFGSILRALGCRHLGGPDATFGLGLAIGNAEVSLVELVGAYGCLARGGTWLEPCALAREVEAQKGVAPPRVFSPGA